MFIISDTELLKLCHTVLHIYYFRDITIKDFISNLSKGRVILENI